MPAYVLWFPDKVFWSRQEPIEDSKNQIDMGYDPAPDPNFLHSLP